MMPITHHNPVIQNGILQNLLLWGIILKNLLLWGIILENVTLYVGYRELYLTQAHGKP